MSVVTHETFADWMQAFDSCRQENHVMRRHDVGGRWVGFDDLTTSTWHQFSLVRLRYGDDEGVRWMRTNVSPRVREAFFHQDPR